MCVCITVYMLIRYIICCISREREGERYGDGEGQIEIEKKNTDFFQWIDLTRFIGKAPGKHTFV